MRASLIQIAVTADESVENRRVRVASLVREQAGADLVVLPELWPVGAWAYELFDTEAEALDGPTAAAMSAAARDAGVWLHAGSIVERAGAPGEGGPLYNTSLLFSPDGELVRTYRKIHRFGFDTGEAVLMSAGDEVVTATLPITATPPATGTLPSGADAGAETGAGAEAGAAQELTVGLATCYDLRFPELFRLLVDAGAQALLIPAGWPARRREHWTLLARARAVENQAYVLACGTAGRHAGVAQAGHSIVVDPWGEVLAEAGPDEQVLTVELDVARVATTRQDFPALRDRLLGLPTPRR